MGNSSLAASFLLIFAISLSSPPWVSSYTASSCLKASNLFLYPLQSQCPFSITPTPPTSVDGDALDRMLTSDDKLGYTCVLFYASWCQFSQNLLPTFEKLSFMFPQIQHLMVEQSSTMQSVLSRYGIHSFPSFLIVNETTTQRYRGPKSFLSLVQFYEKTTGLEPVHYYNNSQPVGYNNEKSSILRLKLRKEPYLAFLLYSSQ